MKLRVLIVDDEPVARRRLRRILLPRAEVEVLAECADGAAAVTFIHERKPDLVFLDVQMPNMNGFEMLAAVGAEQMPMVIFVTAYDEFALRAFDAQALDYLLKPFGEARVLQALERARTYIVGGAKRTFHEQLDRLLAAMAATHQSSSVLVKSDGRVLVLRTKEIDWIEADGDYVHLHVGRESHLLRSTLSDMERRLSADGFARIHRSRLVNLDRVKELRPISREDSVVVLRNGERLAASQSCLRQLHDRLCVKSK
jgi:two-component system LytT family response regulator